MERRRFKVRISEERTELKLALRSAVEEYDLEHEADGAIVIDTEVYEEEIRDIIARCNVDR